MVMQPGQHRTCLRVEHVLGAPRVEPIGDLDDAVVDADVGDAPVGQPAAANQHVASLASISSRTRSLSAPSPAVGRCGVVGIFGSSWDLRSFGGRNRRSVVRRHLGECHLDDLAAATPQCVEHRRCRGQPGQGVGDRVTDEHRTGTDEAAGNRGVVSECDAVGALPLGAIARDRAAIPGQDDPAPARGRGRAGSARRVVNPRSPHRRPRVATAGRRRGNRWRSTALTSSSSRRRPGRPRRVPSGLLRPSTLTTVALRRRRADARTAVLPTSTTGRRPTAPDSALRGSGSGGDESRWRRGCFAEHSGRQVEQPCPCDEFHRVATRGRGRQRRPGVGRLFGQLEKRGDRLDVVDA